MRRPRGPETRRSPANGAGALALLMVLAMLMPPAAARARQRPVQQAARHFKQGEMHYEAGHFERAVKEFLEANRLASHEATVFNIARCYESLGNISEALSYYGKLLEMTRDVARKTEIQQRMELIRRRTQVGVLVATEPAGARVTVNARERAETQETPALIKLSPGLHVLQLRREGHQLAVARVEVKLGETTNVRVRLEPLQPATPASGPASAPAERAPCPGTAARCPVPGPQVDTESVHLHAYLLSTISLTDDAMLMAGPGIQLHATYRQMVFGGRFLVYIIGERDLAEFTFAGKTYNKQAYRRWVGEIDGGWMWPWRSIYFYTTGSVGVLIDRAVFDGPIDDFLREKFAFTWSVGAGMEVKALRWLSLGTALRFGMGHGERVDRTNPAADADDANHWPIGTFWMSVAFHL